MNEIRLNTRLIASLKTAKLMSVGDMVEATIRNKSTWYRLLDSPDDITVQQLLAIANGLHIPVRRFFLIDGKDAAKKCEDCVVDDGYLPCDYDADALRKIVESRPDATWQKAADATGMTRDNLKNSLLANRRTPAIRFLEACQTLRIDPFTILLDPNPEPKKSRRTSSSTTYDALRTEAMLMRRDIEVLRQDVDTLTNTVGTLTEKYEALLKAHEALLHSVQINIDTISGGNISNIGIAATPKDND